MNIKISETNHLYFDDSVLKDIGKFEDLQSWLLAIKNDEVTFYPMDCAVRINHKWLYVVKDGLLTKDIDTVINKVKRIPAVFRNFPNDYMEIEADSFEKELFFNTNYYVD